MHEVILTLIGTLLFYIVLTLVEIRDDLRSINASIQKSCDEIRALGTSIQGLYRPTRDTIPYSMDFPAAPTFEQAHRNTDYE